MLPFVFHQTDKRVVLELTRFCVQCVNIWNKWGCTIFWYQDLLLSIRVTRIKTNLLKWSAHSCCVCSKLQSTLMLCIVHGSRRKVRIVVVILCGLIFKTLATSLAIGIGVIIWIQSALWETVLLLKCYVILLNYIYTYVPDDLAVSSCFDN
jgi:hypothetical protein